MSKCHGKPIQISELPKKSLKIARKPLANFTRKARRTVDEVDKAKSEAGEKLLTI